MLYRHPFIFSNLLIICFFFSLFTQASTWSDSIKSVTLDNEEDDEIAAVITATINGFDARKLSACIEARIPTLNRTDPAPKIFAQFKWIDSEVSALKNCSAEDCKYELPKAYISRLADKKDIDGKKAVFFQTILDLALRPTGKTEKPRRLVAADFSQEPCGKSLQLSSLLEKPLASTDRMTWEQFRASERMRPTTRISQVSRWPASNSWCIGQTLLFADHYYDDHVELLQFTPSGDVLQIRYVLRSRMDFFRRWIIRQSKWVMRNALKDRAKSAIINFVQTCSSSSNQL